MTGRNRQHPQFTVVRARPRPSPSIVSRARARVSTVLCRPLSRRMRGGASLALVGVFAGWCACVSCGSVRVHGRRRSSRFSPRRDCRWCCLWQAVCDQRVTNIYGGCVIVDPWRDSSISNRRVGRGATKVSRGTSACQRLLGASEPLPAARSGFARCLTDAPSFDGFSVNAGLTLGTAA
jgi:hypothetical protein